MKKPRVLLIFMMLAALMLTAAFGCTKKEDPVAETVTDSDLPLAGKHYVVAINSGYPPFESINEKGEIEGFDVDLNDEIATRLGFTYEFTIPKRGVSFGF